MIWTLASNHYIGLPIGFVNQLNRVGQGQKRDILLSHGTPPRRYQSPFIEHRTKANPHLVTRDLPSSLLLSGRGSSRRWGTLLENTPADASFLHGLVSP